MWFHRRLWIGAGLWWLDITWSSLICRAGAGLPWGDIILSLADLCLTVWAIFTMKWSWQRELICREVTWLDQYQICVWQLEQAYREVEQGLTLLGVTAVEDKLQDEVPETITALRNAGIKVRWAFVAVLDCYTCPTLPPPSTPSTHLLSSLTLPTVVIFKGWGETGFFISPVGQGAASTTLRWKRS